MVQARNDDDVVVDVFCLCHCGMCKGSVDVGEVIRSLPVDGVCIPKTG